jgi:hypothetical protein
MTMQPSKEVIKYMTNIYNNKLLEIIPEKNNKFSFISCSQEVFDKISKHIKDF